MISAISSPNAIRSAALHACVVEILMFPAIEYPTAMTWKYWGICFWSSMLLMWFLASIPLGLSVAGMGELTWMIRHQGLAVFSWWLVFGTLGVEGVGCVRVFWWALAATWAQDVCAGIGVVFLMGSGLWGCMVSGMKSMSLSSSSITLLVRYALVSARLVIMCLSMLSSLGLPMSFVMHVAQFTTSRWARSRLPWL